MKHRETIAYRAVLEDAALGDVSGVHAYEVAAVIEGIDRPVDVVSCYSDRSKTLCLKYKDFILVVHNSYLLSFVDNLGLAWLQHSHVEPVALEPFTLGFARKFVAEQLYQMQPSSIARVLLLETVMAYEPHWRTAVLAKASQPVLDRSSRLLTRVTADFLLHHEIGHIADVDARFSRFVKDYLDSHFEQLDLSSLSSENTRLLREEMEADLFSVGSCIATYAPVMREASLCDYLVFAIRSVIALNVLYAFTDDIYRLNVDPKHAAVTVDQAMLMWSYRELGVVRYIREFDFQAHRVTCAKDDALLAIHGTDELFGHIWSGEGLTECLNDDHRRFAEIIDRAFKAGGCFQEIVDGCRDRWTLGPLPDDI